MCIVKFRFMRDTQMANALIFRLAEAMHFVNRLIAPRETPDSRIVRKWTVGSAIPEHQISPAII